MDETTQPDATDENADGEAPPTDLDLLSPHREWPSRWMGPFIAAMQNNPTIAQTAIHVGVDRTTVHRAMQRIEEFALAVNAARDVALDRLEAALYLRATTGQQVQKTVRKTNKEGELIEETVTEERHISDTLGMFYLKRWRPEYRESFRVEQTGANGGPIQVAVVEEAAADFDARLADLEARQAANAAADG